MQEAVESLRKEFGSDAVILHTKKKRRWFFGRFGRKQYELVGAVDPNFKRQENVKTAAAGQSPTKSSSAFTEAQSSTCVQQLFQRLLRQDIPRELAQGLLKDVLSKLPREEWSDLNKIWSELDRVVAEKITTVEPWEFTDGQKIVVLVGPTGVGKTTTIAKLAANFALVSCKKVGLITVDTYRIAAVEQLKTYADIIGVPIAVAYSPQELKAALAKMSDRDLVLIDTAGRSQNNHLQIGELKNYLEGLTVETHLVISATTKQNDVDQIIEVFGQFAIDRLIITKLDETSSHGIILHTNKKAQAPIAFVTTGQGVPEDIEVADKERIAQLILGD